MNRMQQSRFSSIFRRMGQMKSSSTWFVFWSQDYFAITPKIIHIIHVKEFNKIGQTFLTLQDFLVLNPKILEDPWEWKHFL